MKNAQSNQSSLKSINIPFTIKDTPRDFFKLPEDDLRKLGLEVTKIPVDLSPDCRYLTASVVEQNCDFDKNETVIFNMPTNTGKSTAIYDIVEKLAGDESNIVLVCSPFTKLVEKDYGKIRDRVSDIIHYDRWRDIGKIISTKMFDKVTDVRVHVMTIHCLLRHPGEDAEDVSERKQEYLDHLLTYAKNNQKKVYIFIDEIHESVHLFEGIFIPNLLKWKPVLQNVFIASATFTPSSYSVVQIISKLTDNSIQIFEGKRVKLNSTPAKVTVHLLPSQGMQKTNITDYTFLQEIVESAISQEKQVNILSWSKGLVQSVRKKGSPLEKKLKNFNVVVGGNSNNFLTTGSNIGTSFKTGIDIDNPENVFIILFPTSFASIFYGIFNDRIPSMIQSLSRQRNGGDCHLVMGMPEALIKGTDIRSGTEPLYTQKGMLEAYKPLNEHLQHLVQSYKTERAAIEQELGMMHDTNKVDILRNYPSLQDYLWNQSDNLKWDRSLSGGYGLSPYVLWALTNNQLDNVSLFKVNLWYHDTLVLKMSEDADDNWKTLIGELPDVISEVGSKNIHEAFALVHEKLTMHKRSRIYVVFSRNKLTITKALKDKRFNKFIVDQLLKNAREYNINTILTSLPDHKSYFEYILTVDDKYFHRELYNMVHILKNEVKLFYEFLEGNLRQTNSKKHYLLKENADMNWSKQSKNELNNAIKGVVKNDPLSTALFTFTPKKKSKDHFNQMLTFFTGYTSQRRKYKGVNLEALPSDWKLI